MAAVAYGPSAEAVATEVTLQAVLGQLDDATNETVLSVLKALRDRLPADLDAGAVKVNLQDELVAVQATNLDIAISALRDAITGIGAAAKTVADVVSAIQANQPRTVTGTVTVANPTAATETGLAKETTLSSVLTAVDGLESSLANLLTELGQKLEPGGSVNVVNFPTTQAVTGPLTDGQLRANPVSVTGTVTVANPTANPETGLAKTVDIQTVRDRLPGALDVDGGLKVHLQNPDEAGLTDAQLRATPVPVSGTVTANLGTIDGAATEVTLAQVLTKLQDIYGAVDGLEVTAENIEMNADTLNLNTDEVESLLQTIRDRFPAALNVDGGFKVHVVNQTSGSTDVTDRVNRVLGHVEVDNFPASQADALTDTELRASPVQVTVTNPTTSPETGLAKDATLQAVRDRLPATLDVDGGLKVHLQNPDEAGLTDAELRAAPVSVTDTNPPQTDALTDVELRASPVPVSGTVTANLGTIDGAATETTLAAILTELGQKLEQGGEVALNAATLAALENITVTVSNPTADPETGLAKDTTVGAVRDRLPATLDVDGGLKVHLQNTDEAGLTDAQLRAAPVPVDANPISGSVDVTDRAERSLGHVLVDNLPVPQTDALTDTELRANPVEVLVTNQTADPETGLAKTVDVQAVRDRLPAALDLDGGLKVHLQNPDQGGLTDAELRATPVPVSGPLTNTQLRAAPLAVDVQTGAVEVTNIAALSVVNAIEVADYDLGAALFTGTTTTSNDYILSRLEAHFSTPEERTITVRTADTLLWEHTQTALDVDVRFEDPSFDAGDEITVTVSQTAGPCLVDLKLVIQQGSSMLGGNPVLGEGNAHIGVIDIEPAVWTEEAAAVNAEILITRPAATGQYHHLTGLDVGFDAVVSGASMQIEAPLGNVIYQTFVHDALSKDFNFPLRIAAETAVTIRLSAGGAGVTGRASMRGYDRAVPS